MRLVLGILILFVFTTIGDSTAPERQSLDERQLDCMVKNAFYEANGEGAVGRQLVMQVVHNRAPGDWCSAVYAYKQFSWTLSPKRPVPRASYELIKKEVIAFHAGYDEIPDSFRRATHFHTREVNPYWASKLKPLGHWKNHEFYHR